MKARFQKDHGPAVLEEDAVNGNRRDRKLEASDRFNGPFSKTYTKYLKEKDDTYTIESYIKNQKILKPNIRLNIK